MKDLVKKPSGFTFFFENLVRFENLVKTWRKPGENPANSPVFLVKTW